MLIMSKLFGSNEVTIKSDILTKKRNFGLY